MASRSAPDWPSPAGAEKADASPFPRHSVGGARRAGGPPPDLAVEVAELVHGNPDASPVLCDVSLYEPEPHEAVLGSLALVIETLNLAPSETSAWGPRGERTRIPVLENVASTLRDEYYRDPPKAMLASFESALAAANAALANAAENGDTDWLTNFQAAVCVFRGRTLHASRVGTASLFLARHGHLTDIGEGLSDPRIRNPRSAFTTIASGTVSEQDALVLASPVLFRFLARERLASFLVGKHPREVVAYLRDLLAEASDSAAFGALFLRFVRAPIALPAPSTVEGPAPQSFSGVGPAPPREDRRVPRVSAGPPAALPWTLRRPRLLPREPLRLRQRWPDRALTLTRRSGTFLWRLLATRFLPTLRRVGQTGAQSALRAARTTSTSAREFLARPPLPRAAGGRPLRVVPSADAAERLRAAMSAIQGRLRGSIAGWPTSTKLFSALTAVLAVLFIGSLILLREKREEDVAIRQASEKLQEARVKREAAAAALIYDNSDEARRLLREARSAATAVADGSYYDEDAASLLAAIQAAEDQAERITRVPEPARVGDFRSVVPDGRIAGLALVGTDLFAFQPDTNALFRLSGETGETTVVSQTSQGVGYFRAVATLPAEQMLLLATDAPGLALFDTARGDLVKQDLEPLPEGTKEIRALATFGSRLYLLLPATRQILGYGKTLAGYQGGTPWLKDPNLSADRAVDMGVDGYIYLLLDDGKIIKLLKGAPVDFAQSELAAPLEHPTRLFITESLKFLYVLDPPQKRVVVYDTTGKLSRQFVFPSATDLRDLAVGGKDETLYALDGTAVYKVPLK